MSNRSNDTNKIHRVPNDGTLNNKENILQYIKYNTITDNENKNTCLQNTSNSISTHTVTDTSQITLTDRCFTTTAADAQSSSLSSPDLVNYSRIVDNVEKNLVYSIISTKNVKDSSNINKTFSFEPLPRLKDILSSTDYVRRFCNQNKISYSNSIIDVTDRDHERLHKENGYFGNILVGGTSCLSNESVFGDNCLNTELIDGASCFNKEIVNSDTNYSNNVPTTTNTSTVAIKKNDKMLSSHEYINLVDEKYKEGKYITLTSSSSSLVNINNTINMNIYIENLSKKIQSRNLGISKKEYIRNLKYNNNNNNNNNSNNNNNNSNNKYSKYISERLGLYHENDKVYLSKFFIQIYNDRTLLNPWTLQFVIEEEESEFQKYFISNYLPTYLRYSIPMFCIYSIFIIQLSITQDIYFFQYNVLKRYMYNYIINILLFVQIIYLYTIYLKNKNTVLYNIIFIIFYICTQTLTTTIYDQEYNIWYFSSFLLYVLFNINILYSILINSLFIYTSIITIYTYHYFKDSDIVVLALNKFQYELMYGTLTIIQITTIRYYIEKNIREMYILYKLYKVESKHLINIFFDQFPKVLYDKVMDIVDELKTQSLNDNSNSNNNNNEIFQQRVSMIVLLHISITILYTDLVGFTELCQYIRNEDIILFLHIQYSYFDGLLQKHKATKYEVIGDAYIAIADASITNTTTLDHSIRQLNIALDMLTVMDYMKYVQYFNCFTTSSFISDIDYQNISEWNSYGFDIVPVTGEEYIFIPQSIITKPYDFSKNALSSNSNSTTNSQLGLVDIYNKNTNVLKTFSLIKTNNKSTVFKEQSLMQTNNSIFNNSNSNTTNKKLLEININMRIGIHTVNIYDNKTANQDTCFGGIIGRISPRYNIFGTAFTVASKLESTCIPDTIHISDSTYDRLHNSLYVSQKIQQDMNLNFSLAPPIKVKQKVIDQTHFEYMCLPTYWVYRRDSVFSSDSDSISNNDSDDVKITIDS